MNKIIIKKKLIYPSFILFLIFIFSAFVIIGFNQTAFSNESKITSQIYYPGTRWTKPDNLVGASKIELNTNNNESKINIVEFVEDIDIPELPTLPEIPLTEEDK